MRTVIIALVSYGTALNGILFGLWLTMKWPFPRWHHIAVMASLFIWMFAALQLVS